MPGNKTETNSAEMLRFLCLMRRMLQVGRGLEAPGSAPGQSESCKDQTNEAPRGFPRSLDLHTLRQPFFFFFFLTLFLQIREKRKSCRCLMNERASEPARRSSLLYKNNSSSRKISLLIALAILACHYCSNLKVVHRDTESLCQEKKNRGRKGGEEDEEEEEGLHRQKVTMKSNFGI